VTDQPFLSAADLISHNLVDWQEAVAIVQAVCDRLMREGGGVPELSQIGLAATGEVVLLQAVAAPESSVRQLGYALVALLQGGSAPPPLRLFASQTTASNSQYRSLDEFSRGLSYFGRPDRLRVLQDAYGRASAALAAKPVVSPDHQANQYGVPSPAEPPRPTEPRPPARHVRLAVAAVAIVAASIATYAVWRRPEINPAKSQLFNRTAASAAAVVKAGVSSGRDLLSKVGLVSPPPVVPAESTIPDDKPAKTRRAAKTAASRTSTAKASDPVGDAASGPAVDPAADSATTPPGIDSIVLRPEDSVPDHPATDTRVYTADDAQVSLPTLSWPQLPALPRDTPEAAAGHNDVVVDLLINEEGTVESVKFVTPPADMRQRMLISAIKAWRYHPALKDGRPVRFLHRVRLTS
jgi:hypothetical protein